MNQREKDIGEIEEEYRTEILVGSLLCRGQCLELSRSGWVYENQLGAVVSHY